jgi:uroporphyrinogen decarboxylase
MHIFAIPYLRFMKKILLQTLKGEATDRPPVWLMRQAGRILPQYRALRSSLSGFKELVETPDLAAEVTLQPVDELGVDAAIIFSDILVIPEALGLPYEMIKGKGPYFPRTIKSRKDIEQLQADPEHILHQLQYVPDALRSVRSQLSPEKTLIGFGGAPWTLLAYMIEGEGSKTFSRARRFLIQEEQSAHLLLEKITRATITYFQSQVSAGAEVIQLFDSWAGLLSPALYHKFGLPYIRQILESVDVPTIFFGKGAFYALEDMKELPCEALGIDWNMRPSDVRKTLGEQYVVQGNLDPASLYGSADQIEQETHAMIKAFGGHHIVNLGHGVYPDTPLDGVKAFVNAAQSYSYNR